MTKKIDVVLGYQMESIWEALLHLRVYKLG
jgi:hypothetical protein